MKCHAYETDSTFTLCVEDAPVASEDHILAAWFHREGDAFIKCYPADAPDKDLVTRNFPRLGPSMFSGTGDWRAALMILGEWCAANGIDWHVIGSVSEAILGVDVMPHDIDFIVPVKDFFAVRDGFAEFVVEPFVDNKGTWLVRYFGRLYVGGMMIDVASDEKLSPANKTYHLVDWQGLRTSIEPLQVRYETEVARERRDRIAAIEAFLEAHPEARW
ncbi:MAG: hypothetical protein M9953_06865 [Thermomicrobiales bacterium]|nr:hypothetical protein [Thermomicrobiales bacterium]MCO5217246.1 hypothetical protein [Thermomicrobiales bacterium]MCO5225040.1 hypothetical protein [Thermomicrobiales bacterium]